VFEPGGDAAQVTDAVAVAVLIRAGLDLVEDLAVPPVLQFGLRVVIRAHGGAG
jgi:hypothetical protein